MRENSRTSATRNRQRDFQRLWRFLGLAAPLALGACGAQFTHVAPGQSARLALSPVPVVVPATVGGVQSHEDPRFAGRARMGGAIPAHFDRGVPLPERDDPGGGLTDESVGDLAMQAGNHAVAISIFENLVKRDPTSVAGWTKLVRLYERTGDPAKAAQAYKKLKQLGQPNGAPNGREAGDLLGLGSG
jgi:hypothetical protein